MRAYLCKIREKKPRNTLQMPDIIDHFKQLEPQVAQTPARL